MSRICTVAIAALISALSLPGSAKELKYAHAQTPLSLEGRVITNFSDQLKKTTDGRLTMRVFPGGQLLTVAGIFGGIRSGVADAGFVVPPLAMSALKNANVITDLLPHQLDILATVGAANQTVMMDCEKCQGDYVQQNTVMLGGHATTPWQLMCSAPFKTLADLSGRKVRVIGSSATRLVRSLGLVGVQLPGTEIASAMSGGQIDCAVGPINWLSDMALWGTAKYVLDLNLGISGGLGFFVFNKNTWEKLTADERAIVLKLISGSIAEASFAYLDMEKQVRDEAQKRGTTFVKPDPAIVSSLDEFRKSDLPSVEKDMLARGVEQPKELISIFLSNYKKWDSMVSSSSTKQNEFATLLYDRILSHLPAR